MKHPKPHHQVVALDAFVGNLTEISAILARLQSAVEDHLGIAPENVSWGHVGDTAQITSQLREIRDRLYYEGEYAEAPAAKEGSRSRRFVPPLAGKRTVYAACFLGCSKRNSA